MIKIYNAYANHGKIELEDYITFNYGIFDTGYDGYGDVHSGNLSCTRANYELQTLKSFREYLKSVRVEDGYLQNFKIWNPMSYESLAEEYKDIDKTPEAYEEYGLNEEGILLFTQYIHLGHDNNNLVKRLFGRCPYTDLYLLMPNASVSMTIAQSKKEPENYEVLQSQSLGKQLVLTKMNRKI